MTDMTIDEAQQELDDLGYAVQVDADTGSLVADLTAGRHYAAVTITPGHLTQLVTTWFRETPDGPRKMNSQNRLGTVAQTVERARDVAAAVALSHAADVRQAEDDMVPAIFYDQLAAKYGAHAEDPVIAVAEELAEILAADEPNRCSACTDGHTYSGDCRYEVVAVAEIEVQALDAEPAQDGAESDSAVTA